MGPQPPGKTRLHPVAAAALAIGAVGAVGAVGALRYREWVQKKNSLTVLNREELKTLSDIPNGAPVVIFRPSTSFSHGGEEKILVNGVYGIEIEPDPRPISDKDIIVALLQDGMRHQMSFLLQRERLKLGLTRYDETRDATGHAHSSGDITYSDDDTHHLSLTVRKPQKRYFNLGWEKHKWCSFWNKLLESKTVTVHIEIPENDKLHSTSMIGRLDVGVVTRESETDSFKIHEIDEDSKSRMKTIMLQCP